MPDKPMRFPSSLLLLAAVTLQPSITWACPDCAEGIRRQVRAGIFDESFAENVGLAALPFGVLAGITAVIHFGAPRRRRQHE